MDVPDRVRKVRYDDADFYWMEAELLALASGRWRAGSRRFRRRATSSSTRSSTSRSSSSARTISANEDFMWAPHDFDIDRANARQHIGFGHGIHTCAGAPLARAEGRVTVNRFLDRTADIAISGAHHGPAGDRRYDYLPTFFLRGLERLHLDLTPAS
jgi:hypothetical protein